MNCIICNINLFDSHNLVTYFIPLKTYLCNNCKSQFKPLNKYLNFSGLTVFCEYEYNDFFRKILLDYKNPDGRRELVNSFIEYKRYFFFVKFMNYKIIVPPSFSGMELRRGYNHIWGLARLFKFNNIYSPFEKIKNIKQSVNKRESVETNIAIKNNFDVSIFNNKKVLFFDDVITTGKTLKKCYSMLHNIKFNKIKFFVLATKT